MLAPLVSTLPRHRGPVQLPMTNKPCQPSVSLPAHWRQQGSRMRWVGRRVMCVAQQHRAVCDSQRSCSSVDEQCGTVQQP
jgi:hypothetical protein